MRIGEGRDSTLLSHSDRGQRRTALGQSETNVTTEPWSAVEWIADADLTRASFYWDSVAHCRNPSSACQVRGRAIPCSDCSAQRRADLGGSRQTAEDGWHLVNRPPGARRPGP